MPIDHAINNVGEYWSAHYLDSTFAKDIASKVSTWKELGSEAVPRRLAALSRDYFTAKTAALDEAKIESRIFDPAISAWYARLLATLGYSDATPVAFPIEGGERTAPLQGLYHRSGTPWLAIVQGPSCLPDGALTDGMPSEDPFGIAPDATILPADQRQRVSDQPWEKVIGRIFTVEHPPRWILFHAGSQTLLLDQHTFAQGRYLAIDWDEAFARAAGGDRGTDWPAIAALLSRECLAPKADSDAVLHEALSAGSHKFAHAVSSKLQAAVRTCIETLANEWVRQRKRKGLSATSVTIDGKPRDITPNDLRHECLVTVYRLIFCFYAEARGGELGILPTGDAAYSTGYSLESLRDLELVPLSEEQGERFYFHHHLSTLFRLIHDGFDPGATGHRAPAATANDNALDTEIQSGEQASLFDEATLRTLKGLAPLSRSDASDRAFTIRPLTATLFSPDETPLLNGTPLANRCWQEVIRRLSLGEEKRSIGRINYAELGINQLGAVYEGLMAWQGVFVPEREGWCRVHKAGEDPLDPKVQTWFVPKARLGDFEPTEIEHGLDGRPRLYEHGTFLLHLTGFERQQTASYYTPEVLTQCLVRETLRERLKDFTPERADEILRMRICEPAMGSGAFLIEAIGQLADHYLDLKQQQIKQQVDPSRYADERRRVMHYLATRCVYGVDLNPTAVELGSLTLWLASIHRLPQRAPAKGEDPATVPTVPGTAPWFGLRLRPGNSLIGARRAVFTAKQLVKGHHAGPKAVAPRLLAPGESRANGEIYHWLVFDEDMVPASGEKLVKEHHPDACEAAKRWLKEQVKPAWTDEQCAEAERVCQLADQQWQLYAQRRQEALLATQATASVWPEPASSTKAHAKSPTLAQQEAIKRDLEATSGAFQRLKLVLDAWCSLFFQGVEHYRSLPSRGAFLACARFLLEDLCPNLGMADVWKAKLGFDVTGLIEATQESGGVPDTLIVEASVPWLGRANRIAEQQRFLHWELAFPEVLGSTVTKGGFDLMFGNPPWIKISMSADPFVKEARPNLAVKDASAQVVQSNLVELLGDESFRSDFFSACVHVFGASSIMCCRRIYPLLLGQQTNLYKNFIERLWSILSTAGAVGLLHPESIYDDNDAGVIRREIYRRIRTHYQFSNALLLFSDVHPVTYFSVNVYGPSRDEIDFINISNLYSTKTIEASLTSSSYTLMVPGLKGDQGQWETAGHPPSSR